MKLDPILLRVVPWAMATGLLASCVDVEPSLDEHEAELTVACGSEANCRCAVVLNNVIEGLPYNQTHLDLHDGPDDPLTMFESGGSENIAVECRAARYNGEVFWPTYASQVIGPLVASLDHARDRGHAAFWREGASVCAEGDLPRLCLDLPAGTFRHELRLGTGGGAACVAGCGGAPPPMP